MNAKGIEDAVLNASLAVAGGLFAGTLAGNVLHFWGLWP